MGKQRQTPLQDEKQDASRQEERSGQKGLHEDDHDPESAENLLEGKEIRNAAFHWVSSFRSGSA